MTQKFTFLEYAFKSLIKICQKLTKKNILSSQEEYFCTSNFEILDKEI
jgi:hypothetical protein